jgi:hypothetical protein
MRCPGRRHTPGLCRRDAVVPHHRVRGGLALAGNNGDRAAEALLLSALGDAAGVRGDESEDERLSGEALRLFEQQGDRSQAAHSVLRLADVAARARDLDLALARYDRAVDAFSALGL